MNRAPTRIRLHQHLLQSPVVQSAGVDTRGVTAEYPVSRRLERGSGMGREISDSALGMMMLSFVGLALLAGGSAWAAAPAEEVLPACPLTCAPEQECPEPDPAMDPERCLLPTDGAGRLVIGHPSVFSAGIIIGGVDAVQLIVDPRGFLTFDNPWGAAVPEPLEGAQRSLVAAFWADLHVGQCPELDGEGPGRAAPQGRIIRERAEQGVRIVWADMPLRGCPDGARASFSVELNTDERGRLRQALFEYPALPGGMTTEPRAGLALPGIGLEFLEDLPDAPVRDRAKRLAGYGTDRAVQADGRLGPIIRGVWRVEIARDGGLLGDADGDGVRSADNCGEANPWQWNADGDEFGDACDIDDDNDIHLDPVDNCPQTYNPGQEDRNGDGIGDHCTDTDGDLLVDAIDLCPHDANTSALDLDVDGTPDACDEDIDGDDVIEGPTLWSYIRIPGVDTCPYVRNIDRRDRDKDGLGDACDLRPDVACRGFGCLLQADSDGDSINNWIDVCPTVPDPAQIDNDGDGVGDACDWDKGGDGVPDRYGELRILCDPGVCGPR